MFIKEKIQNVKVSLEKRILWADIAKALAIFCIIWGHAGSGSNIIFYRNVLYTFHIPVFLIVSGFLMKFPKEEELNIKGLGKFFLKNLLALVIPYLFWSIFFCNFTIKNIVPLLFGSYQTIKTVNVIGALWFIPAFVIARTIVYLLMFAFSKLKIRKVLLAIAGIGLMAIGFILPLLDNGYFWSFNIALVLAGFVILGVIVKPLLDILSNAKWWIILIVMIVGFTAFFFGTFFRGEALELVCIYNGKYGNIFWFIYNAIFGTITVISLSMLLAKSVNGFTRTIQYIGNQTIGLLFFHVPVMRQVMMPWFTDLGFVNPDWLVAFIAAICTLIICLTFNLIVTLVCPTLLGKKIRNQ